ncbi:hypothetical protein D3C71_1733770 [compost metagenome]
MSSITVLRSPSLRLRTVNPPASSLSLKAVIAPDVKSSSSAKSPSRCSPSRMILCRISMPGKEMPATATLSRSFTNLRTILRNTQSVSSSCLQYVSLILTSSLSIANKKRLPAQLPGKGKVREPLAVQSAQINYFTVHLISV